MSNARHKVRRAFIASVLFAAVVVLGLQFIPTASETITPHEVALMAEEAVSLNFEEHSGKIDVLYVGPVDPEDESKAPEVYTVIGVAIRAPEGDDAEHFNVALAEGLSRLGLEGKTTLIVYLGQYDRMGYPHISGYYTCPWDEYINQEFTGCVVYPTQAIVPPSKYQLWPGVGS